MEEKERSQGDTRRPEEDTYRKFRGRYRKGDTEEV
jgi:hypothetical protein